MHLISNCSQIDNCLEQLRFDDHLAVGVSREYVSTHSNFTPENLFCFDNSEHIESSQISILSRHDRQFLNAARREIRAYLEAGLISKWLNDEKVRKYETPGDIYFEMKHVIGLIVLSLGLCSVAIPIFIMEKFAHSKFGFLDTFNLRRKLEYFVDGRRHYLLD